jgi:hypothetical protein
MPTAGSGSVRCLLIGDEIAVRESILTNIWGEQEERFDGSQVEI